MDQGSSTTLQMPASPSPSGPLRMPSTVQSLAESSTGDASASSQPLWISQDSRSTTGLSAVRLTSDSSTTSSCTLGSSTSDAGEWATNSPARTASPIHLAILSGPHMTTSMDFRGSSMASSYGRSLRIQCLPPEASTLHLSISADDIGRMSDGTCHTCTAVPGGWPSSGTLSATPKHLKPWICGASSAGGSLTARRASRSRTASSTRPATAIGT